MKTEIYMIQIQDPLIPEIWRDLEQTIDASKEQDLAEWQVAKPHHKFRLVRVTTTREVVK